MQRLLTENELVLFLSDVELSSTSHGPALTITIKRHHSNDISVDLVLTLPWSQPLNIHGWPRKNSRKVFNQNIVKDVEKKGLHLVPKGDETWTISYSKAEEELLANIDDGNQCRKEIMKFLKYYLDVCKTESSDGLPGLSSYIIKVITYMYCYTVSVKFGFTNHGMDYPTQARLTEMHTANDTYFEHIGPHVAFMQMVCRT